METKVSTKGQVVLPSRIRRRLGLQPGDSLEAKLDGEHIVLTPQRPRRRGAQIIMDSATGLPVLKSRGGGLKLTSEQVREILADFP
ncbi:MAG TPA: AbrB/MazE/SpoVT family DNA-binding domain-containing protein [Candidatus Acidoferrales bacterium]|jgi:AbrB family looped-hinge helix DNA binding protein|nr:AbrB/MazE/SpoVT family DNA-binding domain-containing protein [Candidatus Acidoferrales bacterium]